MTARGSWVSLPQAAVHLDLTPTALRRTLERRAVRLPDGGVEAWVDGVRARKFGRLWRVRFDDCWLSEDLGAHIGKVGEGSRRVLVSEGPDPDIKQRLARIAGARRKSGEK